MVLIVQHSIKVLASSFKFCLPELMLNHVVNLSLKQPGIQLFHILIYINFLCPILNCKFLSKWLPMLLKLKVLKFLLIIIIKIDLIIYRNVVIYYCSN